MTVKNDKLIEYDLLPPIPLPQGGLDAQRNRGGGGGFAQLLDKEMKSTGVSGEKTSSVPEQGGGKLDKPVPDKEQKTADDARTGEIPDKEKQKPKQEGIASVQEAKGQKKAGMQTLEQQAKAAKHTAGWPELSELIQENRKITATAREASINVQAERINLQNSPDLEIQLNLNQVEGLSRENGFKRAEIHSSKHFEQEKTAVEKTEIINRAEILPGPEESHLLKENQGTKLQLTLMEGVRLTIDRPQPQAKLPDGVTLHNADRAMVPELVLRRVEDAIQLLLNRNDNSLTVKLYPPEMGRVQIDLQVRNGGTEVKILAETPQVREVIQANLEQLRNSMENSGYLLSRLDVEVGGFSRFTHNQGQRRNVNGLSFSGRDGADETEVEQNENPAAVSDLIRGGRVNLVV